MQKLVTIKLIGILLISSILLLGCTETPPPVADFSASPTGGVLPLDVQFTDESKGEITTWNWDFDNDGVVDSTEQSPSYTYDIAGTYTVSLEVTGPGGTDTETKTDYINISSLSGEVVDMIKMISPNIDMFVFMDIVALRADDDLEDLCNGIHNPFIYWSGSFGMHISDVNYLSVGDEAILVKGDFNLDGIEEELEGDDFNKGDYRGVEVWDWEYGDFCMALISSELIILGSKDDVRDCIGIIMDGYDSLYDDSDYKDVVDRLPNGIVVKFKKDFLLFEECTYDGLEISGVSCNKKDKDTMTSTFVLKFEDETDVVNAMNDIKNDLEDSDANYMNIRMTHDGEYLIINTDQDMEDFVGEDQDEDAATELEDVGVAVSAAMAGLPVGTLGESLHPLVAGDIKPDGTNTVGYIDCLDNNVIKTLDIGIYIQGGLTSLIYEYHVATDGSVIATTGPLAE